MITLETGNTISAMHRSNPELLLYVIWTIRNIYIYIYIYYELPMQSVPITTKVVSSNPVHGVLYSIQHYVIKFVSDLRSSVILLRFPPPIKMIPWYNWNIVESGVKHHNTNAARGMFIPEK